jgi:hypothetical protein
VEGEPLTILDAALEIADAGFSVFPCRPEDKRPALTAWPEEATTDRARLSKWWGKSPELNVGIITDGLVVVDIDGATNPWPEDPDRSITLAGGPVSLTPGGGRHILFRAPDGFEIRNSTSRLGEGVDVRGTGGYIVAPPSRLPGGVYRWAEGAPLVAREALPVVPDWILDELENVAQGRPWATGGDIPAGSRNDALYRLGCYLRRGGLTGGEIGAALDRINRDRCSPGLPSRELAKVVDSVIRHDPDAITVADLEDHHGQDRRQAGATADPGPFPEELLEVPGLVNSFRRYSLEIAIKKQPILSLAAGLSLQSVLAGRKIRDPRGARTNLYIVAACASGGGKESPRQAVRDVLFRAGVDYLEGAEGFASEAGLLKALEVHPVRLFQVDEFGRFLEGIASSHGAPHLRAVPDCLMRLFSAAGTTYKGRAFADETRTVPIVQPCASIYGTTTPSHFYGALGAEALEDGFFARLFVFHGDDDARIERRSRYAPPPDDLVEMARAWGEFSPGRGGNLAEQFPEPVLVEPTPDAAEVLGDYCDEADEESRSARGWPRSIWSRAPEKAGRLAMIYAASRGGPDGLEIDVDAARWATRLSDYLTRSLIFNARLWVYRSKFDERQKRVLRIVRDLEGRATLSQLTTRLRDLAKRERHEVIANLVATGQLRETIESNGKPGRPRAVYVLGDLGE